MENTQNLLELASATLHAESESIIEAAARLNEDFAQAVLSIYESKGRLVITGIGKSAHIAQKIVATLNSTGTRSIFLHAAEAVHGDLGLLAPEDVVMCISKSGNSPEIKVLVPLLKRDGNILIAMTSNDTSYLAKNADFTIDAFVAQEACPLNLAPTNSTTVQLALGDALAVCLMHLKNITSDDFAKFHPGGALGKKLLLKIHALLDPNNKPQVSPKASIQEVIIEISSKRLGVTAVVDGEQIVGIITDGDIRRMLEKSIDFGSLQAQDIMSHHPKTIVSDALVAKALEIMEDNAITQLVVTENNKYQGIIHLHDVLKEGIVL